MGAEAAARMAPVFTSMTTIAPPAEKGTGPICRNGPEGASHKLDLSPFPRADSNRAAAVTILKTEPGGIAIFSTRSNSGWAGSSNRAAARFPWPPAKTPGKNAGAEADARIEPSRTSITTIAPPPGSGSEVPSERRCKALSKSVSAAAWSVGSKVSIRSRPTPGSRCRRVSNTRPL